MKWKIIIILIMFLLIHSVSAIEECPRITTPKIAEECMITSTWNYTPPCTDYVAYAFNESGINIQNYTFADLGDSTLCSYTWNISTVGSYYYVVFKNSARLGDTGNILINSEEDEMASLGIILFVNALALAVFIAAFKIHFTDSEVANMIIKRCLVIFGLFLTSLNTVIVVTIADTTGLGVNRELFRYLWIINWTIYLFMVALFWTGVQSSLKLWNFQKKQKRMGLGDDDYE